ncbi:conserved hypothetical protein [Limnobacter sp. 130]|uniref:hypothetical protein n=1 Tax=Limnobacter sp. 130 TaxID=2653147 RepID=UPI0012F21754|nr:hypothetical protein [Limnobacter sp. 130]VWX37367.1 conserved hypothetical protein [Limnobacter sp. 130]
MQNSTLNLHAQLQHSTAVLDGFISDVQTLKKESSELTKSVNSLAKVYLKQCKRFATPPCVANPVLQKLENLHVCSSLVHDQADNLKVCLDAVMKNSYKPDLKRADQGKPTKVLVQAEQEAATFETHIRLAESLVASVLPQHAAPACYNALSSEYRSLGNLVDAFEGTQGLINTSMRTPLLGELRVGTLKAAALHLRDQVEAPSVRQRVPPATCSL